MKLTSLRCLALLLATSLVTGCNPLNTVTTTTTTGSAQLTGDWTFVSNPSPLLPLTALVFTGALSQQGNAVTATLRSQNGCVSSTLDIAFSGTQSSSTGVLTLTSTDLPNNVATLTGSVIYVNGGAEFSGTLVITGSGACAMSAPNITGIQYQSLTGTYTGPLVYNGPLTSGPPLTVTATFTESAANADGLFPVAGSITATSGSCSNVFPVSGFINGSLLLATLSSTSGPAATAVLATNPPLGTTVNLLPLVLIVNSPCDPGSYSSNLNKQ